jgi:pyruvate dehydrogenase E1 component alpha subunit
MPRETIETRTQVELLSILDEDGELDDSLEPDLSDERLERMHRQMRLARRFDERMLSLQRQGRIGTFAPVKGQEAAQVGSAAALAEDDWIVPAYREIAVHAWLETPLEGMLLYNAGYNEGGHVPDDQRILPNAVPVGTQMIHAAGLAYGLRVRERDEIVLTYFGDGATSEGDFHEALNFAAVFDCPVVFLCQNNQYAISVPRRLQTASRTLAQKGLAYGLPCLQVDGNDVLAVYAATDEAVRRAREEATPTMIECLTYRLEVHTTVDDPSKYRDDQEVEAWEARDPLPRFAGYLERKGLLDDERLEALEAEIEDEIEAAVERWTERMVAAVGLVWMFDHVYAEAPPELEAQREAVAAAGRTNGSRVPEADGPDRADVEGAGDEERDDG